MEKANGLSEISNIYMILGEKYEKAINNVHYITILYKL